MSYSASRRKGTSTPLLDQSETDSLSQTTEGTSENGGSKFAFRKTTTRIANAIFSSQKGSYWGRSKKDTDPLSASSSTLNTSSSSSRASSAMGNEHRYGNSNAYSTGHGSLQGSSRSHFGSSNVISAIPSSLPSSHFSSHPPTNRRRGLNDPLGSRQRQNTLSLKDRLGNIGSKETPHIDEEEDLNPNLKNPLFPLTEQQIITFCEIFYFYADQNLTGAVPIETLPELLLNCGLFFVQESLRNKYLKKFSSRYGDYIEMDEFLKICANQMKEEKRQVSRETMKMALQQIFESKNETVEVSEMKFVLEHLGEPLQEHEVENMFEMIPIEHGKFDSNALIKTILEID